MMPSTMSLSSSSPPPSSSKSRQQFCSNDTSATTMDNDTRCDNMINPHDNNDGFDDNINADYSDMIRVANEHIAEEQLLEAARILRKIQINCCEHENCDPNTLFTDVHRRVLHIANVIEESVQDFLVSTSSDNQNDNDVENESEWTKQGESHGSHDFTIYYKVEQPSKLTCKIESPIVPSLLVPLLSVLNESDLYQTWIPSWNRPFRMGISSSKQLLHDTRGHQVIQVKCNVPWPLSPREALFDVQAVDDIASNGFILAKMRTVTPEMATTDLPSTFVVPPLESGTERAEFDGAVLFRSCPTDHPCYSSAISKLSSQRNDDSNNNNTPRTEEEEEDLIMVQFMMYFDAHMTMIPQSVINFVTRSAIGTIWSMLLNVAEQVRDGTRTEHCSIIQQKADFYGWVERRVNVLLEMNHTNQNNNSSNNNHNRGDENEKMNQRNVTMPSSVPSTVTSFSSSAKSSVTGGNQFTPNYSTERQMVGYDYDQNNNVKHESKPSIPSTSIPNRVSPLPTTTTTATATKASSKQRREQQQKKHLRPTTSEPWTLQEVLQMSI